MFSRRTVAGITVSALALATFGAAAPSGAADTANTTVEFTVASTGSGLSVATAASSTIASAATVSLTAATAVTGSLSPVTVTDQRGGLGLKNWKVEVSGTDFAHVDDATVLIPDDNARVYINALDVTTAGVAAALGGMVVTGGETSATTSGNHLGIDTGAGYTLLSGTTTSLLTGSVTFTPTMSVQVPTGAAVGTYRGTVTYTAS